MSFNIIDNVGHVMFDSLADFDERAPKLYNVSNAARAHHYANDPRGYNWFGCNGGALAMELVRKGWPEMLAKLEGMLKDSHELLDIVSSHVKLRKRKRVRGDYGDSLDITRVWGGQLDTAWERPVKMPRLAPSHKHVTIYVDESADCSEKAETLLWRAAAALMICDLVQRTGRSIEVYCGWAATSMWYGGYDVPKKFCGAIRIKEYSQPLNPEHLAAMLTPAFFRTFLFMAALCAPYKATEYLGYLEHTQMPHVLEERKKAGELVIDIRHCNSKTRAEQELNRVRDALQNQDKEETYNEYA